jgi:hypothetical protein
MSEEEHRRETPEDEHDVEAHHKRIHADDEGSTEGSDDSDDFDAHMKRSQHAKKF